DHVVERDHVRLERATGFDLDLAFLEPPVADVDSYREADQVGVGELEAGAGVAVVQQHVHAGGGEMIVNPVGGGFHFALVLDRRDDDAVRRDRGGPDDALVIVQALDGGDENSTDADAV